jgi:hypothetical protein
MEKSNTAASDGTVYPDVMTLPTNNFAFTTIPEEYYLSKADISRIDVLIGTKYGVSDYYDVILDVNNIDYLKNMSPGDPIYFPTQKDLDDFYLRFH